MRCTQQHRAGLLVLLSACGETSTEALAEHVTSPAHDAGEAVLEPRGDGGVDAPETPMGAAERDAEAPPLPPTFTTVYGIFQARCALCHIDAIFGELDLTSRATAYEHLVGTIALGPCSDGVRTRVVPGDPDASFLMHKLEGTQDCGDPMPTDAPLSDAEIALVRAWIERGAKND